MLTLLSYEIFGATVLRPGQFTKSLRSRLKASERCFDLSITGCPSHILDALDFVNSQHQAVTTRLVPEDEAIAHEPTNISDLLTTVSDLEQFDAENYAIEKYTSLAPGEMSLNCFTYFCLAWKIAAKLYTTRVIFTITNQQTYSLQADVNELIQYCKIVTQEYPGIKCFVWPVFIAGVECDTQADRDWVIPTMDRFWQRYFGANIKAVALALSILWKNKGATKEMAQESSWNWVKELHLVNVNSLLGLV
jgi:hypothetical protein